MTEGELPTGAGQEFVRVARKELRHGTGRVRSCLDRLTTEQIWHRDNAIENSVGNLVLHLAGNVRQWIVSGVGGDEDRRDRDWEFSTRDPLPAPELVAHLESAVGTADSVLAALDTRLLVERRRIQVYEVTLLHAITHVLTHFAGHVGQIIWATKHVTGADLGFYSYLSKEGAEDAPSRSP